MYCRDAVFLAGFASNVLKASRKPCPGGVHFSVISPESRAIFARAYIIVKFRHCAHWTHATASRPARCRAHVPFRTPLRPAPCANVPPPAIVRAPSNLSLHPVLHVVLRTLLHARSTCCFALYPPSRLMLIALPPCIFLVAIQRQLVVVSYSSIPYFCGEGYLAGRIGVP